MMKKKAGLIIGSTVGALILGLGVYQASADAKDPKLNTDEVRKMVTEQYSGNITELELEKDAMKTVYEVEVTDGKKETDLKLDASTGEVLKEKARTYSDDNYDDDYDDNQDDNNNQNVQTGDLMSEKEIIAITKKEFDGDVRSVELDEDDGKTVYEIELFQGKKTEADFEIDAVTGEILEMDIETEEDDDDDNDDGDDD